MSIGVWSMAFGQSLGEVWAPSHLTIFRPKTRGGSCGCFVGIRKGCPSGIMRSQNSTWLDWQETPLVMHSYAGHSLPNSSWLPWDWKEGLGDIRLIPKPQTQQHFPLQTHQHWTAWVAQNTLHGWKEQRPH